MTGTESHLLRVESNLRREAPHRGLHAVRRSAAPEGVLMHRRLGKPNADAFQLLEGTAVLNGHAPRKLSSLLQARCEIGRLRRWTSKSGTLSILPLPRVR